MKTALWVCVLILGPFTLWSQTSSITVDVAATTPPAAYRVNTGWGTAVAIFPIKGKEVIPAEFVEVTVSGLRPVDTRTSLVQRNFQSTGRPFIQFERCTRREEKEGTCPSLRTSDGVFRAVMNTGNLWVTVRDVRDGASGSIALDVVRRESDLLWSGGLGAFDLRDQRYRLDTTAGSDELTITRLSNADPKLGVVGLGNWMGRGSLQWLGLTLGVSIDADIKGITAVAGPTVAIKTFDDSNTLFLTLGYSYGQRDELNPVYEGRKKLPAGTEENSLITKGGGSGLALIFSFGFGGDPTAFRFITPKKNTGS